MARHRQRDQEAGGEGFGVVETRKKLWKDADGNIVRKRPAQGEACKEQAKKLTTGPHHPGHAVLPDSYNPQALHAEPPSPPKSMLSVDSFEQFSHQLPELPEEEEFTEATAGLNMFDFLANSSWGSSSSTSLTIADGFPCDDIFNPDTASSFNMPFTTMSNYNWLFDTGTTTCASDPAVQNASVISNPQRSSAENQVNIQCEPGAQRLPTTLNFNKATTGDSIEGASRQPMLPVPSIETFLNPEPFQSSSMGAAGSAATTADSISSGAHTSTADLTPKSDLSPTASTWQGCPQLQISQLSHATLKEPTPYASRQTLPPTRPRGAMPVMDDISRNKILDLLTSARPKTPEGLDITQDHPPLSLFAMQNYLDLFFSRFNVAYPLLHQPTFDPSRTQPLLLLSVLLLGATYSGKAIHGLAVCIHDVLRAQVFQHSAFSATPELWILQTILLVECFGKSRAGQKQHDMSHLSHGLLINLIRRSDCQTVRQPSFSEDTDNLDSKWRKAIDVKLRKRLAFLCFLWDTQHAVLFSQSLCMSSFELRITLPCNQTAWEATSAEEWWRYAEKEPPVPYLSALKVYMTPDSGTQPPQLNALSRLLILHGLMSIQWDMKRRDQSSLGVVSLNQSADQPRWQDRLAQCYDAWKTDFDSYCMNMSLSLSDNPAGKAEFTRFSTATLAIYHAAHITLNVEILDLQIYAGANHILGRPVTRADYDRSRRVVKDWAKPGGATPAARAAWHAAHLLRDGIMNLDNWDANDSFHYPWCLYLSTLTCWAFHDANTTGKSPGGRSSNGAADSNWHGVDSHLLDSGMVGDSVVWHAKAEMNALVSSMTSAVPKNLWRGLGKYPTSGLTAVIARHLGNIRWAVVHEAMKVLKGLLVPERGSNEYATLLK